MYINKLAKLAYLNLKKKSFLCKKKKKKESMNWLTVTKNLSTHPKVFDEFKGNLILKKTLSKNKQ